jgi:hypothetical protein
VADNDLAGDTLSVTGPPGANVQINTMPGASLNLSTTGLPTVNVDVHGVLKLTAQVNGFFGEHVNFDGGTMRFIGTSTFKGSQTVFSGNMTGSATINVSHGANSTGGSESMEINGVAGPGLVFNIEGGGPPSHLRIDDPHRFFAQIAMPSANLVSSVTLAGVQATSADLIDDLLLLFDGRKLADAVRVDPGGGFNLEQTSQGVVMFGSLPPSGPGTPIPIHVIA